MHFRLLLSFLCTTLLFAGCSNEFEDIFKDESENVFAPIILSDKAGWEVLESSYINEGVVTLVSSVLAEAGAKLPRDPNNTDLIPPAKAKETFAAVINDNYLLKNVTGPSGTVFIWPEIDFSQYSLVLGWYVSPGTGTYVDKQRIRVNANDATLYLDIKRDRQVRSLDYDAPYYFATLYPKFDGNIQVRARWE